MSFSRRGIIAAGLAIATVGAVGITSTLTAGATTVPTTVEAPADDSAPADAPAGADAPAPAPADAPAATTGTAATPSRVTPPPGLPGGRRNARRADVPQGRPLSVTPRRAPKGNPARLSATRATRGTLQAAPVPPVIGATAAAAAAPVKYHHSQASQEVGNTGAFAFLNVATPELAKADHHTLAEIAVRTLDGRQVVEVGWNVDRNVNGDTHPRLFVYHWVDGVPKCYNGCGFQTYSPRLVPGSKLPLNGSRAFDIQFFGDGWWIGYDYEWVGFFPSSLWGDRFKRAEVAQWYGEIATPYTNTCTDMGNGLPGTDPRAVAFTGMGLYGAGEPTIQSAGANNYPVDPLIAVQPTPPRIVRDFRFGGPGLGPC